MNRNAARKPSRKKSRGSRPCPTISLSSHSYIGIHYPSKELVTPRENAGSCRDGDLLFAEPRLPKSVGHRTARRRPGVTPAIASTLLLRLAAPPILPLPAAPILALRAAAPGTVVLAAGPDLVVEAQRQPDALSGLVHLENLHLHDIARLHDITRVLDEVVRHRRHVHETVLVDTDVD